MEKYNGLWGEFKAFISKGNVIDMAVGVIIGAAFKAIVDSLVKDIIMPLISGIVGGLDFSNWFIALDGSRYETLADAQAAGAATLNYGVFFTAVINFLIMAFVIFMMIKVMNKLLDKHRKPNATAPETPKTKVCRFCKTDIPVDAIRCPHCTSNLE
ncbi:MAG TPA: large conductance mechanosensitive channel protein MscL [Clostridia bacterium]|nr:large conductance mechanosensitive channel protein MscL [Clostridia bacterium]